MNDTDADLVRSIAGEFGNGVKVGLIDAGVDCTHSDLSGRIVGGHDYPNIGSGAGCVHFNAHGTGTAGILAASANSAGVIGMAPEVDLYSITACDSQCLDADLASAINWAVDNDMDVISYSIGNCGGTISNGLTGAVEDAVAAGIVFVAAAGNGSEAPPCNSSSAVSTVARIAGVIGVSAIDSTHAYLSAHQHGSDVDISAPTYVLTDAVGGGTQVLDGTSAATPHVAGAAALLIGAGYAPSAVFGRLTSEAVDRGSSGKDNYYGYGSLDALAAIRRGPQISGVTDCYTPPLYAGSCEVTPTVAFGLPSFEYRWQITYSNSSHAPIDTGWITDDSYSFPVPYGDYAIEVTTTVRESPTTSPRQRVSQSDIRSYPVCPGGALLLGSGSHPSALRISPWNPIEITRPAASLGGGETLDAICP